MFKKVFKFLFLISLFFVCLNSNLFSEEFGPQLPGAGWGDGGWHPPMVAPTDPDPVGGSTGPSAEEIRAQQIQAEIDALKQELSEIPADKRNTTEFYEKIQQISEKGNELNTLNQQIAEQKADAAAANADINQTSNSDTPGDPVRATTGTYIQSEIDIERGTAICLKVERTYEAENTIISGFGYGWRTNLDERIITGVEPGANKVYAKKKEYEEKLKENIESMKSQILKIYNITELSTQELESRKAECERISKELEDRRTGEGAAAREKAAVIQGLINELSSDLSILRKYESEYERQVADTKEYYQNILVPTQSRHITNGKVLFKGMGNEYEETGLETVSVIDEGGYPHLLYETGNGSGIWKNSKDKTIDRCERNGRGYKVVLKNGTIKEYSEKQFLEKITNRNGNWIAIERDVSGKIETVRSSEDECYHFSYENGYISKITNLRDITETVEYKYKGNKLVSVKDTDGDAVRMEYDQDGHMTKLLKCDGSEVKFEYGKEKTGGKLLTTSTTNEEGKTEYFDYDIAHNITTYKDHDGNVTVYHYDDKHRTVEQQNPDGTVIKNIYDAKGNLKLKNINGNNTSYDYDSEGNPVRITYQNEGRSYTEKYEYDSCGYVTKHTDCDGITSEYIRDSRGNITEYKKGGNTIYAETFDDAGRVKTHSEYTDNKIITSYEYDRYGNRISKITNGIQTEYKYDGRNRLTDVSTDGKLISRYTYDGKATKRTDYNGLETEYEYNGRKDLIRITQKDQITGKTEETGIVYDRRHLPVKVYAGDGQRQKLIKGYVYSGEGKVTAEISYSDNGKDNYIRVYEYENGEISEVKQFKVQGNLSENPESINIIEAERIAGNNIFIQKYKRKVETGNKRKVSVTDGNGITSLFEYDSYGNLVKYRNGNEEISEWKYSGSRRLEKEQSSYGGWYEYSYDSSGRLNSSGEENSVHAEAEYYSNGAVRTTTDRYGKVTEYKYDASGNVRRVVTENSTAWYRYDSFGRIISKVIGPQDNEKTAVYCLKYEYSDDGRSVTVTEGGKYKSVSEMDAFGNVIKVTDGNGNETSYEYDFQNNPVSAADGYGKRILYEYNAMGKVSKTTDRSGLVTLYSYNEYGQVSKVTDEEGFVYSAEYDGTGRIVKEKKRADAERTYEYDKAGRVTRVLCGGETVESYSYTSKSRTVTVKDGNGNYYSYDYDAYGRLVKEKNRLGNTQEYFYDAEGQIKSKNSFEGTSTLITYSSDRTVRTTSYADGTQSKMTYNALGLIEEAENEYGKTVYEYDKGGKLVRQTDVTTGEVIDFIYDAAGNRTKLLSSNRETVYTYGKNNEVLEVYDNKQRMDIKLRYDVNGRETERKFSNGVSQNTYYDKAGRVILMSQKTSGNEITWGEAYLYGADGKRTATADINGAVTLYEYDAKGQLSTVYYPYTKAMEVALKEEAEENRMPAVADCVANKYLDSETRNGLSSLLNRISWNYGSKISAMQLFIKESYKYDGNGNRIQKITPYGTIDYTYNEENFLISSSWNGNTGITYTYDKEGNLLTQESELKTVKYAYNAQNRIMYSEVTDKKEKTYSVSYYGYDAFGRRIIEQDKDEAALRSLYDGFTFDVIKQSPTFTNGLFVDSNETGIRINITGRPTGDRYRYLEDNVSQDNNRYFYLNEGNYRNVSSRYKGSRTSLTVNGTIAGQNADGEISYFTTDLLGSVRTTTDGYGYTDKNYSYDAFGAIIEGDLSGRQNFGYLGKQFDKQTGLYNYGYRDYTPKVARFTTVDPIRDGENWLTYCKNDSVNFVDFTGLKSTDSKSRNDFQQFVQTITKFVTNCSFELYGDISVGGGLSANVSQIGFGGDIGSEHGKFALIGSFENNGNLTIKGDYQEYMSVGFETPVVSVKGETPTPESARSFTSSTQKESPSGAPITNMEYSLNFGPVSISKDNSITVSIDVGIQVVIGVEFGFSITIPY